jgi:hypothetical protein
MRICRSLLLTVSLVFPCFFFGQSTNASLTGVVDDPSKAVIPNVSVTAINTQTGVKTQTFTNSDGQYVIPSLLPGTYRVEVDKQGFKGIIEAGIVLHVQDVLQVNFHMAVGSVSETVTVNANDVNVNTTDASVSTVVDRRFAENLPLNGRSFNTLLELTPGAVIAPSNGFSSPGQFSIAGQRTDANNLTVDGVSANFGVVAGLGAGSSGGGTAQAFSALGGTSSLVSVDALQEFRIDTSSSAAPLGRNSGGQIALSTRSGTNEFHGGVFDYFRNTVLDANNWFNDAAALPKSPEHHNDFGGFFGGPIIKDKLFYFFSYEGARLVQPSTQILTVPSEYARAIAPTELAPYLDAFPLPDDKTNTPGVYTSPSTQSYSNPATLDAFSFRGDYVINKKYSIFGRYNDAPSELKSGGFDLSVETVNTRTLTLGLNALFSTNLVNTFRGNYSTQTAGLGYSLKPLGGAVVPDSQLYLGTLPDTNEFSFYVGPGMYYGGGPIGKNRTSQMNFVDDATVTLRNHEFRFGADYRAIFLNVNPSNYIIAYSVSSVQDFIASSAGATSLSPSTQLPAQLLSQSLSLYAQDTWKASRRLTATFGVRWELVPAPTARGATQLASWMNVDVDNLSQLTLAPAGTALWHTQFTNFAPRFGLAYSLTDKQDLVLRVGGGIFYDLGMGEVTTLPSYFPNSASGYYSGISLPLTDLTPYLVAPSRQPPYGLTYAFSPDLVLPRSYQWNVALEKAFGGHQSISLTYLGQAGRDLLREEAYYEPNSNFSSEFLLNRNDAFSNYDALQVQYRLRVSARLQGLMNYSWSHSLDNASDDVTAGLPSNIISGATDYSSSDFDIRNSLSGALTYALPAATSSGPLNLLTRDWSINAVVAARSGFPFNALLLFLSPDPGGYAYTRPDLVPGQPFYISNPTAPGGKSVNPNAFSIPATIRQGTEGRNDIPGFGFTQVDLSVSRRLPIGDRLNLDFRADAFNVLNHPNFVNPQAFPQFDLWTSYETLNQGLGGLSPLFQQGGPRSLQLSLKLTF